MADELKQRSWRGYVVVAPLDYNWTVKESGDQLFACFLPTVIYLTSLKLS